jgi:5-methylthioribose kinase
VEFALPFFPSALRAEPAGSGNVNTVFRVVGSGDTSVIVKQALPYLKVVGESWPLTIDRARIEAEGLAIANCCIMIRFWPPCFSMI